MFASSPDPIVPFNRPIIESGLTHDVDEATLALVNALLAREWRHPALQQIRFRRDEASQSLAYAEIHFSETAIRLMILLDRQQLEGQAVYGISQLAIQTAEGIHGLIVDRYLYSRPVSVQYYQFSSDTRWTDLLGTTELGFEAQLARLTYREYMLAFLYNAAQEACLVELTQKSGGKSWERDVKHNGTVRSFSVTSQQSTGHCSFPLVPLVSHFREQCKIPCVKRRVFVCDSFTLDTDACRGLTKGV